MKHLLIVLFFLPQVSFSQQDTAKQIIGKIYTKRGGPYSVTVIFHKNKQAIVVLLTQVDSLHKLSDLFESERKKLGNDVVVTIERITYRKPGTNKHIDIDVSQYNQKEPTVINAREVTDSLKNLNFISGNIYFSAAGFINVIVASVSEKGKLQKYYGKCIPGSVITLENCIYRNRDGSLSLRLNKSIKLN